jgi:nucleoside phosphorylase
MIQIPDDRVDVVVLTAIGVEYKAARRHLTDLVMCRYRGTVFEIGTLADQECRVAMAQIGPGNQVAGVMTERVISRFCPDIVMFVGIAGQHKDDVDLGDVVVATWVYDYDSGRDSVDGFQPRPRAWESAHDLLQLAQHVERAGSWIARLPSAAKRTPPAVHFKPVVTGERLVDAADSEVRRRIRRHYEDAAAIEMESAGVARAAQVNSFRRVITIRGVSDRASGAKHETDRRGWQGRAAANAAAFAMALITEFRRTRAEQFGSGGWRSPHGGNQHPLADGRRTWPFINVYAGRDAYTGADHMSITHHHGPTPPKEPP